MSPSTKQNLITALPVFLIGLAIHSGCLIAGGACFEIPAWRLHLAMIIGSILALFIGVLGIIGLIKKIPDWSVIWVSVSIIGLLILLNVLSILGIPHFLEIIIVITSFIVSGIILYAISRRSWQMGGLLGLGLSSTLTILLFFVATNVSHNEIKLGYFSGFTGLIYSLVIYLFLRYSDKAKIIILVSFMVVNSILIYVFNLSMIKYAEDNQLFYLLILSNGLLYIGIILHFMVKVINAFVYKNTER